MIYKPAGVDIEPDVTLSRWQVIEVDGNFDGLGKTYHFVGNEGGGGRVSSPIKEFDLDKRIGVTRSGRRYHLSGEPHIDQDALYVLHYWASNKKYEFVTEEFVNGNVRLSQV